MRSNMKKILSVVLAVIMLTGCSTHVSPDTAGQATTQAAQLMQGKATEPETPTIPETKAAGITAAPAETEPAAVCNPTAVKPSGIETSTQSSGSNNPSDSDTETKTAVVQPKPKPTEPASSEPAPTQPAATEPAPVESTPTEPAPTQPVPTEPVATEPVATEPAPTEPAAPDHVHDWVRNNYQYNSAGEITYAHYRCTICGEWKTVDFTTPPDTGSDSSGHVHTWEKTQYDEVGYWDCGAKCQCGWTCYASESKHDGDYSLDWIDHINSSPKEEWFTVHISWCSIERYILISPAYVEWVCTECGEIYIVQD